MSGLHSKQMVVVMVSLNECWTEPVERDAASFPTVDHQIQEGFYSETSVDVTNRHERSHGGFLVLLLEVLQADSAPSCRLKTFLLMV